MQSNDAHAALDEIYEVLPQRSQRALWEAVRKSHLPYSRATCRAYLAARKASLEEVSLASVYDTLHSKSQQALWQAVSWLRLPYSRDACRKYIAARRNESIAAASSLDGIYRSLGNQKSQAVLWEAVRRHKLPYTRRACRDFVKAQKKRKAGR